MNIRFAEYVTSAAFSLTLTKAQIAALNSFILPSNNLASVTFAYNEKSIISLWQKGLLNRSDAGFEISEEGLIVAKLLEKAGLINKDRKIAINKKLMEAVCDQR
jgi:hypothetical protein